MKKEVKRKTFIPKPKSIHNRLPINDQKKRCDKLLQPYYSLIEPGRSDRFKNQSKNNKPQTSPGLSFARSLSHHERYKVAILSWEGLPWTQGGVESILIFEMATALVKNGHEVHVFTRGRKGNPYHRIMNGIHYHCIHIDPDIRMIKGISRFAQQVNQRIKRIESKKSPFDVIHCYNWHHAKIIANIQNGIKRRIVFSPGINGASQKEKKNSELLACRESWETQLIRSSDHIVCFETKGCMHIQKHFSLPPGKVSVIPRDFHWEDFQWVKDPGEIKRKYQIGPVDPLVLFVGELNHDYGPDILVKAIPGLIENYPQIRFLLVGEGELMWPIRIKAHYLLFEHVVRLVGHKEDQDLQELFQAADMVVIPNRTTNSPYQVFAAWSAQKPVIATPAGSCNLIRHLKNGILVYDNSHSIEWGIERILIDWDKGHLIAQDGWREIEQNYTWDAVTQKLGHIYHFEHPDTQKKGEKDRVFK
jgi:glycosyltransferase involved in cell wall biosynthesis